MCGAFFLMPMLQHLNCAVVGRVQRLVLPMLVCDATALLLNLFSCFGFENI